MKKTLLSVFIVCCVVFAYAQKAGGKFNVEIPKSPKSVQQPKTYSAPKPSSGSSSSSSSSGSSSSSSSSSSGGSYCPPSNNSSSGSSYSGSSNSGNSNSGSYYRNTNSGGYYGSSNSGGFCTTPNYRSYGSASYYGRTYNGYYYRPSRYTSVSSTTKTISRTKWARNKAKSSAGTRISTENNNSRFGHTDTKFEFALTGGAYLNFGRGTSLKVLRQLYGANDTINLSTAPLITIRLGALMGKNINSSWYVGTGLIIHSRGWYETYNYDLRDDRGIKYADYEYDYKHRVSYIDVPIEMRFTPQPLDFMRFNAGFNLGFRLNSNVTVTETLTQNGQSEEVVNSQKFSDLYGVALNKLIFTGSFGVAFGNFDKFSVGLNVQMSSPYMETKWDFDPASGNYSLTNWDYHNIGVGIELNYVLFRENFNSSNSKEKEEETKLF